MSRTDNALNGRALALARVSEKAEILRRHYQETRNPLFAWEVIRLFTRLPGPPVPLPPWVSEHLRDVSSALIDLAEGIDRTQAPPIPPVGATDKQIAEFITKYRAFEERPTLDPKQATHARCGRWGFSRSRARMSLPTTGGTCAHRTMRSRPCFCKRGVQP